MAAAHREAVTPRGSLLDQRSSAGSVLAPGVAGPHHVRVPHTTTADDCGPDGLARTAQVRSVSTGGPRTGGWTGRVGRSGIDKTPSTAPVGIRFDGLVGDTVCDQKYHGGPDHAVYAFAREDLDHWGEQLGRALPDGFFGENLTTLGIDVNEAVVGERWRVGTALLEVAKVRTPCRVFAGWLGVNGLPEEGWIKRFAAEGRPGPYLRVLEEGVVEAGDPLVVEHRPDHGITVSTVFRAVTTRRALLPSLLAAPELAADVRVKAEKERDRRVALAAGRPGAADAAGAAGAAGAVVP